MDNIYIKYFYDSYRCSKRLGLNNEYLFYLKLKSLKDGELRVGSITKSIQDISSYSPASISIYLKKLVEAGFLIPYVIKGKVVGYQVISYKRVLKLLGVKIRFSGATLNVAKEHRFQRVVLEGLKDNKLFKNFIELLDIHNNSNKQLFKQLFKQKHKLKQKIKYQKDKLKDTSVDRESIIKQLKDDLKSVQMIKENRFKLSCKKLSRLLGYKSIQQGSLIERRSEKNNFLIVKRNLDVIEKKVEFLEFMIMKSIDESLYWMYGNVVKNDCNELLFTDTFFSHFEYSKQNNLPRLSLDKNPKLLYGIKKDS